MASAVTAGPGQGPGAPAPAVPPLALGPVGAVAGLVALVLLLTSRGYGYHRDELYFLEAGRRLAWGYPDQPPLTPLLARLMDELAPGSLLVLRLPSVAVAVGVVALSALLARELGGRTFAQVLTALAVGTGALTLALGHLLSTASVDLLVWVALSWLAVRAVRTGDERLWLAAGAVAGVGLLNKHLPVFLLAGLAAGAALTPAARPHLRSRRLWAGAALALLLWAPNLAWQAANGWPQLELAADIRAEYSNAGERVAYLALQLVQFSPLAAVLWVWGLVRLWRRPALRWARFLAWAWVLLLVAFLVTAGKGYYLGGLYPALVAAGATGAEARWRSTTARTGALAAVAVVAVAGAPIALPVLPASTLADTPYAVPGEDALETIGWPELADAVAAGVATIPAEQRGDAVVFTTNYGVAGAVARFGPARDLPPAYSGHNAYGWWGPPPEGAGPVVVVDEHGGLAPRFTGCRLVTRVDNGAGVDNEEQGAAVHVCAGPRGGWRAAWPDLVHLDA